MIWTHPKNEFRIPKNSKEVKVKWSRYRPGVAQRVGRGIALLSHAGGTIRGWVVSSTPRTQFTPGKDPVPILQEAGWAPGPVWTDGKSRPHRDFFFYITVTFIALWFHIPVDTLFNLPWSSELAAFVLSFTLHRLSSFIISHLVLWKHFHSYLFSVVAIYYCCVLCAAVSSPFSSVLVIKVYLFQHSFVNWGGGCVLHCL